MTFLVATNVVASRPPERRPTATPTARACKDAMASLEPKDQKSSRNSHRCSKFFIRSKRIETTSNLNQSRISIMNKKTTISYWKPSMT